MTSGFLDISSDFEAYSKRDPDRQAIVAQDVSVSYANLSKIVNCFCVRFQQCGVNQGHLVSVDTNDAIVAIASLLALSKLGASFIGFDEAVMSDNVPAVDYIFRSPDVVGRDHMQATRIDETWSPKNPNFDNHVPASLPGFEDRHQECWMIKSSGTTGRPKYISLSAGQVHERLRAVAADYHEGETRLACFFHCTSRPYAVRALAALTSGCTILDSDDAEFLLAQHVSLVCAAPRFISGWLDTHGVCLRNTHLQLSGAHVDDELAKSCLMTFGTVEDVYGSSETIKVYSNFAYVREGVLEWEGKQQHGRVEIIDPNDRTKTQSGIVRIKSPFMIEGYFHAKPGQNDVFANGWFYPGDRASWEKNGYLRVHGRVDDVVNLGGEKIDMKEVDSALCAISGVRQAVCFTQEDKSSISSLVACVVLWNAAAEAEVVQAAHSRCSAIFGEIFAPKKIYVVASIPMTNDGVPKRHECKRLLGLALGAENYRGVSPYFRGGPNKSL